MNKRRAVRIGCDMKASLEHDRHAYPGRVENISAHGALVRLRETLLARPGEVWRLSIQRDDESTPLVVGVQIVHIGFCIVGVRFLDLDARSYATIEMLLHAASSDNEASGMSFRRIVYDEG
ncbi:PilZ domain-containing protein [Geobacter sp. DSM 9736]|uniref:PilZ domain-containing protein n=1 Tax=Geobacter sp. DSM 9736 TaxID=1277350 RepID=UPI000B606E68|nr:PilZ domain-containing protein [Geobacter sp. DSM 9736]SNB45866.1 PilZ domain-containing protein [Geobacter sp. DSM 9736]